MAFPKSNFIWMDGELVPWDKATVHVGAHALHYGSSTFEGLRAYSTPRGPAIFCLEPHLERWLGSCKMYKMPLPFSRAHLRQAIVDIVRANELASCYIRPIAFRGFGGFSLDSRKCPIHVAILAFEWGRYLGPEALEQGVDIGVSSWRRMAPDTFPAMGKIGGQYVNSQFVAMEANDHGYAEGIALDIHGYVSEGSGENIFVVLDGTIFTPPIGSSILRGITRMAVLTIARELDIPVIEQNIPREMLYIADEVFFTGTAAEVTPIRSIDRMTIGAGRRGPITQQIQERFFALVEGRTEDRYNWLTYVNEVPVTARVERRLAVPAE
jgi:branched-chain amino acid aminotransferase